MNKYDSYAYTNGELTLSKIDCELMDILVTFGESIDCQGFDDGDYDTAMNSLHQLLNQKVKKGGA